ncbi:MAG TPA: hypothetical protein VN426_12010 [Syntrophomonadaceae bacterium]|nr:hypothetical protein [Syntrophomonadaceae bacterium]
MSIIKNTVIPLGRPLYIPREGMSKEDLEIESSGNYLVIEKPDHFIIKNDECCRSIQVIIKTKE